MQCKIVQVPGVRILVVTGAHDLLADDVLRGASWLGDASTMTKPFDDQDLLRTVGAILADR